MTGLEAVFGVGAFAAVWLCYTGYWAWNWLRRTAADGEARARLETEAREKAAEGARAARLLGALLSPRAYGGLLAFIFAMTLLLDAGGFAAAYTYALRSAWQTAVFGAAAAATLWASAYDAARVRKLMRLLTDAARSENELAEHLADGMLRKKPVEGIAICGRFIVALNLFLRAIG